MGVKTEAEHLLISTNSLNRSIKNAKVFGKLSSSNLYILDVVYKLLTTCTGSLTFSDYNKLLSIYNTILYKSKDICKTYDIPTIIKNNNVSSFNQVLLSNVSSIPSSYYAEYWQEDSLTNEIDDIILTASSTTKSIISYTNLAIGKTYTLSNIGRICFLLNGVTSTDYSIYGELESNVTDSFTIQYVESLSGVLIVSNEIYSYGDEFIKIIKN